MNMQKMFRLPLSLFTLLFLILTNPVLAGWDKIKINDNRPSLETVWGTSDNNIYAFSFYGPIYHYNGTAWSEITSTVFGSRKNCYPYGIWGTGANDVYVSGSHIVTPDQETLENDDTGDDYSHYTPFVYRFDGTKWNEIVIDPASTFMKNGEETPLSPNYLPNIIVGIWGTSPNDMYFSGNRFHTDPIKQSSNTGSDTGSKTPTMMDSAGIVLHYNGTFFTGEIGINDFPDNDFYHKDPDIVMNHLPTLSEITGFSGSDLFGIGLDGLILHKNITTNTWSVMPSGSQDLFFTRIWAASPTDVFAVGFNNISARAVIHRYNGEYWSPMLIPSTREGFIPAIWGIWGSSKNEIHAVGNSGVSLYYDGNSGNLWKQMLTDTTSSLNCVWGTGFDNVYAASEAGYIYHFTGQKKITGIRAQDQTGTAPHPVTFTDTSIGEVSKWTWNFGDVHIDNKPVPAIAKLSLSSTSFILAESSPGTELNGYKVIVYDNGDNNGVYLETLEPESATAILNNDITVTAIPGQDLNGMIITVQDGGNSEPALFYYNNTLYAKINSGFTTHAELAALLQSSEFIKSATPETPGSIWDVGNNNTSPTTAFNNNGKNHRIIVRIDSGITTHSDIADALATHNLIESAVATTPESVWVRGQEPNKVNYAYFSGGRVNENEYINTDQTIEKPNMAYHIYNTSGTYTASLTIERPTLPATAVLDEQILIQSIPGTSANGITISIVDGGDAAPSLDITEDEILMYINSGTTNQREIATLLKRHPLIIYAVPYSPESPWVCGGETYSNSALLTGGTVKSSDTVSTVITVLPELYVDFTADRQSGVSSFKAVFTDNSAVEIRDRIVEWEWHFEANINKTNGEGNSNHSVLITRTPEPVSHIYSGIAYYDVGLKVTLDDNSTLHTTKEDYIVVKSPDEDKSSFEGGWGCFVSSAHR